MRYVYFNEDETTILIDRQIDGICDLSCIMRKASYRDWLEGLGQPCCDQDLRNWKKIGEFLEPFGNTDPKDVK